MSGSSGPSLRPVTGWWPLLAGLVLTALFLRLGLWQLDRANEKQALFEAFDQALEAPALELAAYHPTERFQRVRLAGRYRQEPVLLLDNQLHEGRPGVHVYQVFEPGSGPLLLVNRGWLPLGARREPPTIPPRPGRITVSGMLTQPPQPGIKLGEFTLESGPKPQLIPWLEPERVAALLKTELAPQILLSTDDDDAGFVRDWRPVTMPPDRHRAYAFQWFSLAGAIVIIWLALNVYLRRAKRP